MICVLSMLERCDQIVHCRDKSDENLCSLLVLEESYNKKVPPFTINDADNSVIPVSVFVSTSLRNVLEISEFTHTITLKLGLTLEWYENRVLYHNLKTEEALNTLSDNEVGWMYSSDLSSWKSNLRLFICLFTVCLHVQERV